jgi:Tol biopolymer transport system component
MVPTAGTALQEDDATLSSTMLEMVFSIANELDANRKDLWYSSRPSANAAWAPATKLPFSVTGYSDETPRFSADDKTLYFGTTRLGGPGGLDIWKVTRATIGGAWGTPTVVAGPNTSLNEKWFMPCGSQGQYLVVQGGDLAEGILGGGAPVIVHELSDAMFSETGTFLTQDCLTVFFASTRSGTNRLYTAQRTAVTTPWNAPSMVVDFETLGGQQEDPWLSSDGRTFVFASDISGTKDIYISTR